MSSPLTECRSYFEAYGPATRVTKYVDNGAAGTIRQRPGPVWVLGPFPSTVQSCGACTFSS